MSEKRTKMEEAIDDAMEGSGSGAIPQLAQSAKQILAKHLQALLKKLFSSIDDSLFEYADKAGDNQKQLLYFDAMREIRKEQKSVMERFFAETEVYFDDALAGNNLEGSDNNDSAQEISYTTLSLVDEDDLEESLAINNMIEKAHGLYREELLATSQRFSHIIANVQYTSENCPSSPNHICRAFEKAFSVVPMELQIRLIIFKLFDKSVVSQLQAMYHEINESFVNAGILPTIKLKSPVKSKEQQVRPRPQPEQPGAAQASNNKQPDVQAGDVSFDSLRQLLSMHRGQASSANANSRGHGAAGDGVAGGGGSYVTDDVLVGLTDLQGDFLGSADTLQHASVEEIKNNLLAALGKRSGSSGNKVIETDESDVIDLVSMMFEFILEDKSLEDRIRAEIARLQIPIIKVAILDKKFFDQQSHPARLLLNELAYAGGARDAQESLDNDTIFTKVEYVVNRVLSEFQTNVDIFNELLEEFRTFVDTELQSNKVSEKRLEQTKQKVSDEIENRIKQYKIPKLVYEFLLGHWKDVLTTVGMRTGCKGQSWDVCLGVIDDLIWSVQPKLMSSERQELTRSIPKIIKRLKEGLKLISVDEAAVQSFLDQLGTLHLKCLKGAADLMKRKDPLEDLDEKSSTAKNAVEEDEGNPFAADLPAGDFEYFSGTDDFTNIQLSPKAKRSKNYPIVKDMAMGTWVEFVQPEKTRRGKLSWKCDFTGDYTFVDRRYRLVADISMSDLIERLDQKTASIITDVPLLDRAINAVVSTMSKYLQSANSLVSSAS